MSTPKDRRLFDRAQYQASCWRQYLNEPLTLIDRTPCVGVCMTYTVAELHDLAHSRGACPCSADLELEAAS